MVRQYIRWNSDPKGVDPAWLQEVLADLDGAVQRGDVDEVPETFQHALKNSRDPDVLFTAGLADLLIVVPDDAPPRAVIAVPSETSALDLVANADWQVGPGPLTVLNLSAGPTIPWQYPGVTFPPKPDSPAPVTGKQDPKPEPDEPSGAEPAAHSSTDSPPEKPSATGATASDTAAVIAALGHARLPLSQSLSKAAESAPDVSTKSADVYLDHAKAITKAIAWTASTDAELLELVDTSARSDLARDLLRARAGIVVEDARLTEQRVAFESERVNYFRGYIEYAEEFTEDRKRWRALSKWVPPILLATISFSLFFTGWLLILVGTKSIDGWQAAVLVFVLGVVAISPVALLLLERPLQGIDTFKPAGADDTKDTSAAGGGADANSDEKPDDGDKSAETKKGDKG